MVSDGDTAQVETKWTDYFGSISSDLIYKRPSGPPSSGTIYRVRLKFTNIHRDLSHSGKILRETSGTKRWKMEGPLKVRWATPQKATEYVIRMRDLSSDALIRRNAEKTIRALQALQGCGTSSAC
jgi:hypothetical protein